MSTSTSTSTEAKKALVCIGHNKRVVTFSTNLEERIREAFSDILHNGESIVLQVEESLDDSSGPPAALLLVWMTAVVLQLNC